MEHQEKGQKNSVSRSVDYFNNARNSEGVAFSYPYQISQDMFSLSSKCIQIIRRIEVFKMWK